MKRFLFIIALAVAVVTANAQISAILGDWETVDDNTGDHMSVVHIYKATDGLYYGKVVRILKAGHEDDKCTLCEGEDHMKPIAGMNIIRGMKADGDELVGGRVLDPNNGKTYYARLYIKDGKLVLRGSLDKRGFLGRNQTWVRAKQQ